VNQSEKSFIFGRIVKASPHIDHRRDKIPRSPPSTLASFGFVAKKLHHSERITHDNFLQWILFCKKVSNKINVLCCLIQLKNKMLYHLKIKPQHSPLNICMVSFVKKCQNAVSMKVTKNKTCCLVFNRPF
jgi:hypothetical protein